MYKKLKGFLLCGFVVLALTVSSAYADINNGWYYGLGAGGALATDGDWTSYSDTGDFDIDTGFLVSGAIGYKFGMPRLEAEVLYLTNDYDKINTNGGSPAAASGDISSLAFMVNGYLDFANESSFTPFIFAGAGVANVEIDNMVVAGSTVVDDDDTVFAYQVGAGVAIDLSENFILDFKYCYFGLGDHDFPDRGNNSATDLDNEFASHNITIGFRYSF
jgi:opacity protein-like surface antigen